VNKISLSLVRKKAEYEIFISESIDKYLVDYGSKILIITDDNLFAIYKEKIFELFPGALIKILQAGENSKSRKNKEIVENFLFENKFPRSGIIVAFGGGVVGDLAGFVASTYKRGVSFIQIPTSLLAMVDSSVGGKTAINTNYGKNLIGTFWQPKSVYIGIKFLDTLNNKEFLNGLCEVIKIALILDRQFYFFLLNNSQKILEKNREILLEIIHKAVELKANVVQKDEMETGERQILNFGHTIGHAIELASNYTVKHGMAVALGMVTEASLAFVEGHLSRADFDGVRTILNKFGLLSSFVWGEEILIENMKNDKKNTDLKINFVILQAIGKIKRNDSKYIFSIEDQKISKAIGITKNFLKDG